MFEKHEKWFIFGFIALAIYYFYKKGIGQTKQPQIPGTTPAIDTTTIFSTGSLVDPTSEVMSTLPAQATRPLAFAPAQPATVPISQRVSAGQFSFYPAPPVLRYAPADNIASSGRFLA